MAMLQLYKHQILQTLKFIQDRHKPLKLFSGWLQVEGSGCNQRNSFIINRPGTQLLCRWNTRSLCCLSRFLGPDCFPGTGRGVITSAAAHTNQQHGAENPTGSAASAAQN